MRCVSAKYNNPAVRFTVEVVLVVNGPDHSLEIRHTYLAMIYILNEVADSLTQLSPSTEEAGN